MRFFVDLRVSMPVIFTSSRHTNHHIMASQANHFSPCRESFPQLLANVTKERRKKFAEKKNRTRDPLSL
jgi:pyruvate/2-oxoacid:ferredoxin oxidoreductase alpha subunit